jgi:hypothetical protein
MYRLAQLYWPNPADSWPALDPLDVLETLPMPIETLEFLLLLSGWVVAFLLGRELQTGFRQWRLRTAEQRARRED